MAASLPLWVENIAVFDTETTGLDTSEARIVSCAIAIIGANGEVLERYDWLINPGVQIPERASAVHGITNEVAQQSGLNPAVGIAQIVEKLREMIQRGFPVVAYNAPYDFTLLANEAERYGVQWPDVMEPIIDPLILDKQMDRYRKGGRTLTVVAAHYGVELSNAHDAGEDAIAAGRLAQAICAKYAAHLPDDAIKLHQLQVQWAAAQAQNFQEYIRKVRDPDFVANTSWPLHK